jgi:hypothetical protein
VRMLELRCRNTDNQNADRPVARFRVMSIVGDDVTLLQDLSDRIADFKKGTSIVSL